jgi:outer membrane protein assembly factor BamA
VDSIDYSYFKFYQEVLHEIVPHLYGGIGYNLDYHWNIKDYNTSTDFIDYDQGQTRTVSSGLVANIKYDNRVNVNNPKSAFYGSVIYRYNSTLLGSDENWQYVQVEMRKYFKLNQRGTNVLAFWSWNEFTFGGKPPYLDLPSTGWDTYNNTGRGYIQGRFRGNSMVYLESEFRFDITRNGLFGGVLFANAESVSTETGDDFDIISPGYGFGIRIKLNRFSNTNLAVDYGFGTGGSRGFFFNIGEVF